MISLAKAFNFFNQRACKAALFSTLPGMGQLFNRRLDKAIAFFIVDAVNVLLLAVLLGARLPNFTYSDQWVHYVNQWRFGTAPFSVLLVMMLVYIAYSQFDAFRDARASEGRPAEITLSHFTCGSYVLHMSALFAIFFYMLATFTPENHPDLTQITLTFELEQPKIEQPKEKSGPDSAAQETDAQDGPQSARELDPADRSHSKDAPKEDTVSPGGASAELNSGKEAGREPKPAAEESDAVSSKKILSPDKKENPVEATSNGKSEKAQMVTNTPAQSTEIKKTKTAETSEPVQQTDPDLEVAAKPRLIAQLPPRTASAASSAMPARTAEPAPSLTSISSKPDISVVYDTPMATGANPGQPNSVPGVPGADQLAYKTDFMVGSGPSNVTAGSDPGAATAPSMLGFMDSAFSADPDMRLLWSEMSSNISRYVKQHPLEGTGIAVTSFSLNRAGRYSPMSSLPPESTLAKSLASTLLAIPRTSPSEKLDKNIFFQVKVFKENSTFISLEISSSPVAVTPESLGDFKYQVNLQAYLKGIKKAVYSSWKPPVQEGLKPVMVGFKVTTDGIVCNQHIVQSSGDPRLDRAALNAALSVTKWAQPPAGTAEDLDVCMVIQKCHNCDGKEEKPSTSLNGEPVPTLSARPLAGLSGNDPRSAMQLRRYQLRGANTWGARISDYPGSSPPQTMERPSFNRVYMPSVVEVIDGSAKH